jgi:hypothetical protein
MIALVQIENEMGLQKTNLYFNYLNVRSHSSSGIGLKLQWSETDNSRTYCAEENKMRVVPPLSYTRISSRRSA